MYETSFESFKSLLLAITLTPFGLYTGDVFGIYTGAITIATVAAVSRLAYTREPLCWNTFGRLWAMSLSVTLVMVHVGKMQAWGIDATIVFSGSAAFLSQEILTLAISSKNLMRKKLIRYLETRLK